MGFKYEEKERPAECVAFISNLGHLVVGTDEGCVVFDRVDNCVYEYGFSLWESWLKHAVHKFYPGDEVTIKF